VFAHISDADVEDWQSSIDIVLRCCAEYDALQGAFGRRALTEPAKGILMERHAIDEETAFAMLREHSRRENRDHDRRSPRVAAHEIRRRRARRFGGTAGRLVGASATRITTRDRQEDVTGRPG
jgi:ANTAR domain